MNLDSPTKGCRNTSFLIPMESRYPFDRDSSNESDCLVKLKIDLARDANESTLNFLKKYSTLKHEALVEIVNMFESKEGWEVHY